MGVRITDQRTVALYDSVSGTAFGPTFDSESDAEEFLTWLAAREGLIHPATTTCESFRYQGDARAFPARYLEQAAATFHNEREAAVA